MTPEEEDHKRELCAQADALGMESLTEDEQVVVEGARVLKVKHFKYGVICAGDVMLPPCNDGALIELTKEQHDQQMANPNARWKCPMCRGIAYWDDDSLCMK